jgi:DNA-directed RNA polymerase subunit RPC12/RpoP
MTTICILQTDMSYEKEYRIQISDITIYGWKVMVLEAKCPECGRKAALDDASNEVHCSFCGFHALYDEYIEIMRERATAMTDDFQTNSGNRPF